MLTVVCERCVGAPVLDDDLVGAEGQAHAEAEGDPVANAGAERTQVQVHGPRAAQQRHEALERHLHHARGRPDANAQHALVPAATAHQVLVQHSSPSKSFDSSFHH